PGKYISGTVSAGTHLASLTGNLDTIRRLARLQPLALVHVLEEKPPRAASILVGEVMLYLPLDELTDVEAERARLERELESARAQEHGALGKLANESFLSRAPQDVVARERERARSIKERIQRLQERLEALDS